MVPVSAAIITAGVDVQQGGLTVRLSFSLAPPSPAPLIPSSQSADEESEAQSLLVQAAVRAAVESSQELIAAFERAQAFVLESDCLLLERQLNELRGSKSTEDGPT